MKIINQSTTGFGHTTLRVSTGETITIAGGSNTQTHQAIVDAILDAIKPNPLAHQYKTSQDCGCDGWSGRCMVCDGGLAICKVCGGAEGGLTTECPGRQMSTDEMDAIGRGELDYKGGEWVESTSIHSPAAYR